MKKYFSNLSLVVLPLVIFQGCSNAPDAKMLKTNLEEKLQTDLLALENFQVKDHFERGETTYAVVDFDLKFLKSTEELLTELEEEVAARRKITGAGANSTASVQSTSPSAPRTNSSVSSLNNSIRITSNTSNSGSVTVAMPDMTEMMASMTKGMADTMNSVTGNLRTQLGDNLLRQVLLQAYGNREKGDIISNKGVELPLIKTDRGWRVDAEKEVVGGDDDVIRFLHLRRGSE